jgi:hypothetical protein
MFERRELPESQIRNLKLGLCHTPFQVETRKPAFHLPICPTADLPTRLFAHLLTEKLRHEVQSFLCLR